VNTWFAVVNPAAGGGRCGKLVDPAVQRLRAAGLQLELAQTSRPGEGAELARQAWRGGHRRFIAVGGDGTVHEVINGLFAERPSHPPTLGFLPLGTGNSFLRDFARDGLEHAMRCLLEERCCPCDVIRLTHTGGELYYINLLSLGLSAQVATLTNRRFKAFGEAGYVLGILACLWQRRLHRLPYRCDREEQARREPCLLLTFSNSRFTGGNMLIAPQARIDDGLIECVRVGPLGRLALLRSLRRLYDGSYVDMPQASRRAAREVEFELDGPVEAMVDGEVFTLQCQRLDVLPAALQVVA
jgi:YegS/Rv2252/BmrU family lipid kinase